MPYPARNIVALMRAHETGAAPDLRERVPGIPEALARVVARALDRHAAGRPPSARDLGQALARIARALPAGEVARAQAADPPMTAGPARPATPARRATPATGREPRGTVDGTVVAAAHRRSRLSHRDVVRTLAGRADGAVPHVGYAGTGPPLAQSRGEHGTRWRMALAGVRQLASGLIVLHGAGIVHAAVSPATIVATAAGGLALLGQGAPADARYAALELFRAVPPGALTDTYALAVVLFELRCGHAPHDEEDTRLFDGPAALPARRSSRCWRARSATSRRRAMPRPGSWSRRWMRRSRRAGRRPGNGKALVLRELPRDRPGRKSS